MISAMLAWFGAFPEAWASVPVALELDLHVGGVAPEAPPQAVCLVIDVRGEDELKWLSQFARQISIPIVAVVGDERCGRAVMNLGIEGFVLRSSSAWEVEVRIAAAMESAISGDVDPITGLPTWRATRPHVDRYLALARRFGRSSALLLVSLEESRPEPRRLRWFAEGLRNCTRDTDLVARYDGGEFVILAAEAEYEEARTLGQRILHNSGVEVYVGLACSRAVDVGGADDLLRQAVAAVEACRLRGDTHLATSVDCD